VVDLLEVARLLCEQRDRPERKARTDRVAANALVSTLRLGRSLWAKKRPPAVEATRGSLRSIVAVSKSFVFETALELLEIPGSLGSVASQNCVSNATVSPWARPRLFESIAR
jgi:hypothetical protein